MTKVLVTAMLSLNVILLAAVIGQSPTPPKQWLDWVAPNGEVVRIYGFTGPNGRIYYTGRDNPGVRDRIAGLTGPRPAPKSDPKPDPHDLPGVTEGPDGKLNAGVNLKIETVVKGPPPPAGRWETNDPNFADKIATGELNHPKHDHPGRCPGPNCPNPQPNRPDPPDPDPAPPPPDAPGLPGGLASLIIPLALAGAALVAWPRRQP